MTGGGHRFVQNSVCGVTALLIDLFVENALPELCHHLVECWRDHQRLFDFSALLEHFCIPSQLEVRLQALDHIAVPNQFFLVLCEVLKLINSEVDIILATVKVANLILSQVKAQTAVKTGQFLFIQMAICVFVE